MPMFPQPLQELVQNFFSANTQCVLCRSRPTQEFGQPTDLGGSGRFALPGVLRANVPKMNYPEIHEDLLEGLDELPPMFHQERRQWIRIYVLASSLCAHGMRQPTQEFVPGRALQALSCFGPRV